MAEFVSIDAPAQAGAADSVAVLRVDRPPLNALGRAVVAEILRALERVEQSSLVRALIVYGGDKVFATATDAAELASTSTDRHAAAALAVGAGPRALAGVRVPTVAAIGGHATGIGASLAIAADRRIAGDHVKFCFPEVSMGVLPIGLDRLARLVGPSCAKDLVLTSRVVGAEEALAIGLVDEVVAPDEVFDAAYRWAHSVAAGGPLAAAAAKALIDAPTGAQAQAQFFAAVHASEDRRAGVESFLAYGPGRAEFTGR